MTTMPKPRMLDDECFRCLRAGDTAGFGQSAADRGEIDLSNSNLRGSDLRKFDLSRVILRGAYLRDADLRGQDLSNHDLAGCSFRNANIGGVLFPDDLSPPEIQMSIEHGTRLRPSHGRDAGE